MRISRFYQLVILVVVVTLLNLAAWAGDASLAPAPPMGWNSWDSYGQTIDEAHFKASADWMAKHLKKFGWQYMVIDEGWYVQNLGVDPKTFTFQMTDDGRFVPVPARFPSAANNAGFKPVADYVHSLGLKFGLHIIRGIPREAVARNLPIAGSTFHAADAADQSDACPWNAYNWGVKANDAGQAYYDSIVKLYAEWGVDFIKADCIADHPYKPEEIRMLSTAIKNSGRKMVLSLSPGPTALEHADEVAKYAEMWRISDDFWDHWGPWKGHEWSQGLYQMFATTAKWAEHSKPGGWPDADMLPLGHLGPHPGEGEVRNTMLTKDEQRTLMTLWAIFRSPLVIGGDLLSMDDWTTSLLTNPEVIAVNQHSRDNRPVIANERTVVWLAQQWPWMPGVQYEIDEKHAPKGTYISVFNVGDSEQRVHYGWKDLGLEKPTYKIRDLWGQKNVGRAKSLTVTLQPHASVLYLLEK